MESIELVVLFEKCCITSKDIVLFSEKKILQMFNSTFNELSYSLNVKNRLKSKNLKYLVKNVNKLYNDEQNVLNGFELLSLLDKWKYKSQDIKFSMNYLPDFNTKNSCIIFTLNKEEFYNLYKTSDLIRFYLDILEFLNQFKTNLKYGFVFAMEKTKYPNLFVAGVGNYSMSKIEEDSMKVWVENNENCESIIWRVFWGNLITKNHLMESKNINKLMEIVGKDYFYKINESAYFFVLPDANMTFACEEQELLSNQIASLLKTAPQVAVGQRKL